jgi:phosphatidate cytidylyltransferase
MLFVREFARATGLDEDRTFVIVVWLGILGYYAMALLKLYGIFMAMPVHTIAIVYIIPIYRNQYQGMLRRATLATVALVYLGWFPAHLAYLANYRELYAYVLFLMFGTELNDAAAFLFGKLLGRHPLVSRISPGKTIEGALGALVVIVAYVWLARPLLPAFGWVEWVFSVVILWIGGTMGDLVISFVKRDTGVKDMGRLIPGHGGVLDRFDSLIFTSPFFFHMVRYFIGPPPR